ncbi:hypothetical protein D1007_41158 [Hordeum vulgare]|nr:hypothetical protein D1007_41158 [Hordeum vulgare]
MAMTTATASTYGAALHCGTLRMRIRGYSRRKNIRSANFKAGGHIWSLSCCFHDQQLVSVSLELQLLRTDAATDVVAMATLWVQSPGGSWRTVEGRSDDINVFPAWPSLSAMPTSRCWELPLPDTLLHGLAHLDVYCKVSVLWVDTDVTKNACQISMVPPPTISKDLGRLLLIQREREPETTKSELSRRRCMLPDVTFINEQTEIQAHKLVLAMRSPVFAAEFRWHATECTLRVHDMSASTFRAMHATFHLHRPARIKER